MRSCSTSWKEIAPPAFRWDLKTGARSYWINAQGAPQDGYLAALDRLDAAWREHLSPTV